MASNVKAIPEGFHTVTPSLVVHAAADAIDFYKKAFGAEEIMRMPGPDGKSIMHAEVKIGNSILFITDEFPEAGCKSPKTLSGSPATFNIYTEDVDASFKRAIDAGAEVKMPATDMFWGDRYAQVIDPFGHTWGMATHKEDLTPDEIGKRAQAFFAQAPPSK